MQGLCPRPPLIAVFRAHRRTSDSFITVRWDNGTTEGGSSGSGVFHNANGAYHELRGGTEGGAASCSNLSGIDRFSRMDLLFTRTGAVSRASPVIIPTTTVGPASMVEFFNPQFNFYFISSIERKTVLWTALLDRSAIHCGIAPDTGSRPIRHRPARLRPSPATSFRRGENGTRGSHFYTA